MQTDHIMPGEKWGVELDPIEIFNECLAGSNTKVPVMDDIPSLKCRVIITNVLTDKKTVFFADSVERIGEGDFCLVHGGERRLITEFETVRWEEVM